MRLFLTLVFVVATVAARKSPIPRSQALRTDVDYNQEPIIVPSSRSEESLDTLGNGSFMASDCTDYLMAGIKTSGIYPIYPFNCRCQEPVNVWCDMESDGGGWTLFMNRENSSSQLNFNRPWDEYKDGFGDPSGEYWLGNENLYKLTEGRTYTVRLDVKLAAGGTNHAVYQIIKVGSEDELYKLQLDGTTYGTSNLQTCFNYMKNRPFSTIDRDNDASSSENCADKHGGGWWWHNCNYFNPTSANFNNSLLLACISFKMHVTQIQLKLRPRICDYTFKIIHLKEQCTAC